MLFILGVGCRFVIVEKGNAILVNNGKRNYRKKKENQFQKKLAAQDVLLHL